SFGEGVKSFDAVRTIAGLVGGDGGAIQGLFLVRGYRNGLNLGCYRRDVFRRRVRGSFSRNAEFSGNGNALQLFIVLNMFPPCVIVLLAPFKTKPGLRRVKASTRARFGCSGGGNSQR